MTAMPNDKNAPVPMLTYLVNEEENSSIEHIFDSLFEALINSSNNGSDSVIISLKEEITTEGKQ
jgi:hypothetical protein